MSQVVRFLTLAGLAALGLASCGDAPTLPVYGYEVDEFACQDGEDNDFDGLIDCRDPECLVFSVLCGEVIPDDDVSRPEDSFLDCFDRIDNDRNGQFDCGDRKCQAIAETCCLREFTNELCSDGLDNDQNGFADCEDFGCRNAKFVTVCEENTPERCSDGIDNNNNARFGEGIDCADEDCTGIGPCAEPGNCDDDVDNDGNGLTDCEDLASCYADPACGNEPGPEDTLETCSDKVDNDGNGFTDCEDFSCSMNPNQQVVLLCRELAEDTVEKCTDDEDNDGNGFTDCEDFSCSMSDNPAVLEACANVNEDEETSLEDCTDGEDNDGDGFPDCEDFSCQDAMSGASMEAVEFCAEALENTFERCTDGLDNDGNGFIDCGDFSCAQAEDANVVLACRESGTTAFDMNFDGFIDALDDPTGTQTMMANEFCSNEEDEDLDGFVDCDDFDCAYDPLVTVCPQEGRVCEWMGPTRPSAGEPESDTDTE